jgi:hypothetical protein
MIKLPASPCRLSGHFSIVSACGNGGGVDADALQVLKCWPDWPAENSLLADRSLRLSRA